ncbi:MAG: hypothetical protein HYS44_00950 [Candidatus Niyogibacteria bacterium]|nr:hypothetical protein [Candidatus Niyogibacteria bacterium]
MTYEEVNLAGRPGDLDGEEEESGGGNEEYEPGDPFTETEEEASGSNY